jgi:predicted DNA-binding transcriptional regulator AlpA
MVEKRCLIDIKELSQRLCLSQGTIYNGLSKGTFPLRPKRFTRKLVWDSRDVDKFIESLPAANAQD